MRLEDWLTREKETQSGFARRIGCWPQAIDRYLSGGRVPNQEMRRKIHGATGGEVTSNDWDGLPEPRPTIVTLVHPDRRADFEARGWRPWPAPEDPEHPGPQHPGPEQLATAPAGVLMCRKQRDDETWRQLLAELAAPAGWPWIRPRRGNVPHPAALIASGVDPN